MIETGFVVSLLAQKHLPLPLSRMNGSDMTVILQTVCGYLNGSGGWIIIDGNSEIAWQIQSHVVSDIAPLPLVYVQEESFDGKPVVLVTVMKGDSAPYTFEGRFYVMADQRPVQLDADGLSVLWRDSLGAASSWERDNCIRADEDCVDEELMQNVYDTGLEKGRIYRSDNGLRGVLSDLKLLRSSEVTNGVVALFGKDLRSLLPQCRIRIQLMLKGKAAEIFDDNQIIEGNVFETLQKTVDYFEKRLPKISMFYADRTGRYDDFLYPLDVIDEAVSNALIHRDYSDRMDEVTVFIYADSLEITNSGVLPEKVISGKKKVLPHSSILRNPLMAHIFFISGKMEKTGRGMMLISSKMKEAGKRLPEWSCANGKTTLKIFNGAMSVQLNERVVDFLHKIGVGGTFRRIDYMETLKDSVSERTAKNDIASMVEGGWCIPEKCGPASRYIRTAKKLPDIARYDS